MFGGTHGAVPTIGQGQAGAASRTNTVCPTSYDVGMVDERPEPSTTADERTLLVGLLDWHRLTLEIKCAGLTDEQLR